MGRKKNKAGNSAPTNGTESSDKSQPDRGKKKAQAVGQGPAQAQGQSAGPPCPGQVSAVVQADLQSKGPKQYSFGSSQQSGEVDNSVLKISLPPDLERRILELINARRSEQLAPEGSASRRLTTKKLLDVYTALQDTGFERSHVEQAMASTVTRGGDLRSALDWLCLNLPDEALPDGFSQRLEEEEEKTRPRFSPPAPAAQPPRETRVATHVAHPRRQADDGRSTDASVKDWVLRYAEEESDEEKEEEEEDDDDVGAWDSDPDERYLSLTARLLDARERAADAKSRGDGAAERRARSEEASLSRRMLRLESHPMFNPAVKLPGLQLAAGDREAVVKGTASKETVAKVTVAKEALAREAAARELMAKEALARERAARELMAKEAVARERAAKQAAARQTVAKETVAREMVAKETVAREMVAKVKAARQTVAKETAEVSPDEALAGLKLLEGGAEKTEAKKEPPRGAGRAPLDVRSFEYSARNWTGKSPKQFLIDWCRKRLPRSPPPGFHKVPAGRYWRSRVTVDRLKEGGVLEVCPVVVCEDSMQAQHLGATLALWHLCKGQSIHQLLPPPYRDVWLEWRDAEQAAQQAALAENNRPRDEFLDRLLAQLKEQQQPQQQQQQQQPALQEQQQEQQQWSEQQERRVRKGHSGKGRKKRAPAQDSDGGLKESWDDSEGSGSGSGSDDVDDEEEEEEDEEAKNGGGNDVTCDGRGDGGGGGGGGAEDAAGRGSLAACRHLFRRLRSSPAAERLRAERRALPVSQHREQLVGAMATHRVVIVAGETGSGKSTQVPQFLLEEFLAGESPACEEGGAAPFMVVCTQPRRISAVSLARRVNQELGAHGEPGSESSLCGYHIRLERRSGPCCRLLYATAGVLLRRLQVEPSLSSLSHLVVDEVHERGAHNDLLLAAMRRLLAQAASPASPAPSGRQQRRREPPRLILMSATADCRRLSRYFGGCPIVTVPGRTFPVQVSYMEDVVELSGYALDSDSPYAVRDRDQQQQQSTAVTVTGRAGQSRRVQLSWEKEGPPGTDPSGLDPARYSARTRHAVATARPERVNLELVVVLLSHLDTSAELRAVDGAVLVFLPGFADIQDLHDALSQHRDFRDSRRYKVVPLHSVLSSRDQSAAFSIPPPGVRKIVLATNIAETGITIPDVVFVIDAGRSKENRYSESGQMSSLVETFISKASAEQRRGRAGRVQPGFCFRLYTRSRYEGFPQYAVPEIQRMPLEELCLSIMKCGLGPPEQFLSEALDPPPVPSVQRAMTVLRRLGACSAADWVLTPLGHHLAALPVSPRVAKMLIFAAYLGCLPAAAVIAATVGEKSPWVSPIGKRSEADLAKLSLSLASSDHLTFYRAYQRWQAARREGVAAETAFCQRNFLSHNAMTNISDVQRELVRQVEALGFRGDRSAMKPDLGPGDIALLKAVLTAGLYDNVGRIRVVPVVPVDPMEASAEKPPCLIDTPQGPAHVHPSSVARGLRGPGWLLYQEKVKYARVSVRDCTPVGAVPLVLFGGEIGVRHRERLVSVDGWIHFQAPARVGVIFKELRAAIDSVLERKMANPKLPQQDEPAIKLLLELIRSEAGSV
uniref:RNA helicase n=1 Tax=Petromyzon marinus TaxID=7757 RepID=A0AAJ7T6Z3_PETMA|nr:LOW QUALITY PROTEIN: ATP-dependent RNA helicase DHX29 [Petromyzon marinus]